MTDPLVQALLGSPDAGTTGPNCQLRYGTVTQVSPLLVKVGASTAGQPCSAVASYRPYVGDYVVVMVVGADRIAIASALAAPAWTTYAPTLGGSGGNPNMGTTGGVSIRYEKVGRRVTGTGKAVWSGTGGSTGSGYYTIPLPFTAVTAPAGYWPIGTFKATQSGGPVAEGSMEMDNASTTNARFSYAATSNFSTDTALGSGSGLGTAGGSIAFVFTFEATS